jgi:hypothetical protein
MLLNDLVRARSLHSQGVVILTEDLKYFLKAIIDSEQTGPATQANASWTARFVANFWGKTAPAIRKEVRSVDLLKDRYVRIVNAINRCTREK